MKNFTVTLKWWQTIITCFFITLGVWFIIPTKIGLSCFHFSTIDGSHLLSSGEVSSWVFSIFLFLYLFIGMEYNHLLFFEDDECDDPWSMKLFIIFAFPLTVLVYPIMFLAPLVREQGTNYSYFMWNYFITVIFVIVAISILILGIQLLLLPFKKRR